ncbi:unnamed protein product [Discosporangium mesarthrocarpum]
MNFGKRDLALTLSDTVGDADTMRFTRDDSELSGPQKILVPKRDPTKKVHIYRAGQAPGWVQDEEQANADSQQSVRSKRDKARAVDAQMARLSLQKAQGREDENAARRAQRAVQEAQVIEGSDSDSDGDGPVFGGRSDDDEVEGDVTYRPTSEAADAGQVEEDEDDDAIAARRERVRARLRARPEAEVLEVELEEPAKPEDSDSSEWETDTDASDDENEGDGEQVLKPVFVPKAKRETAIERERLEKEKEEKDRARAIQTENRKRETRQMAAEVVRREEEMTENHLEDNDSEGGAPDDDDDLDEELAYEEWKVRELGRVRREKEEKEHFIKAIFITLHEREDTLRRRGMTDEERRLEDAMIGKNKVKDKGKIKFMQKYYHKGAFYMDDESMGQEDVRTRSYHGPTLEDKFDKTQMPRVMQVKKFGRSGQTKWTHLANEDTTDWDAAWTQETHMANKMQGKMSGVGDVDAPFKRRKKDTGMQ